MVSQVSRRSVSRVHARACERWEAEVRTPATPCQAGSVSPPTPANILAELGWRLVRFTNAEVLADPSACAQRVLQAVDEATNGVVRVSERFVGLGHPSGPVGTS
jgi:hypothetical protein